MIHTISVFVYYAISFKINEIYFESRELVEIKGESYSDFHYILVLLKASSPRLYIINHFPLLIFA